jgi:hypothetical protein
MMRASSLVRAFFSGAFALLLGTIAPGCASPVGSYCNTLCDCTGCSQVEREDCVEELNGHRRNAADQGCSRQFDEAITCVNSGLTCTDGKLEPVECGTENEALSECTSGSVPILGPTPCELADEQILARYEACGVAKGSAGEVECTVEVGEEMLCVAACIQTASCGALDGSDPGANIELAACLNPC